MTRFQAAVNAPEFPDGLEWLNVERPVRMADLRGKVVLLDFWTYCCINCMHIIPDLKRLEAKYGDALVVIGVHSAKFTTEKGTDNIRQAILRYGIGHPVVNDKDFSVWDEYAARAWPTLVLVDTRGKVVAQSSGEGAFDKFDGPIDDLVQKARAAGTLDARPLKLRLERERAPESLLSFPGKVLADATSNRLFISDSNHNRVVVADLASGAVLDVIGSGGEGLGDGAFEKATFHHPQGLALDGDVLYVADTENHAIRRADLAKRKVDTIGGNGRQADAFNVPGIGMGVALNSPWDLVVHSGSLYVAMAGFHQIWRMDLKTWRLEPFAGSGRENRVDGPLASAALAQPSGIATDGVKLYVADSEVSSVRSVDLDPAGKVATIVGEALFEFGDVDGAGERVRLQHPLGVALVGGALFVADTYNNKIKRIDPSTSESRTFAGSGEGGYADGAAAKARFDEPGGVSAANGKLYVADTNNNVVRVVDAKTRRVETFALKGLERLAARPAAGAPFGGQVIDLPEQHVAPGESSVVLDVAVPKGFKVNAEAPFYAGLKVGDAEVTVGGPNPTFPVRLQFQATPGTTTMTLDAVIYYCAEGREGVCLVKQVRFRAPVRVETGGGREVRLAYRVER
jgi:DNA-binding beta-propeller fold protein YncE